MPHRPAPLRPARGLAGLPRRLAEGAGRQPLGHLPDRRRPLRLRFQVPDPRLGERVLPEELSCASTDAKGIGHDPK